MLSLKQKPVKKRNNDMHSNEVPLRTDSNRLSVFFIGSGKLLATSMTGY